jgi:hypothetical protein
MSAVETTDSTRRSPGAVRSASQVADGSGRDRLFILIPLGRVVALSWANLAHLSQQMSSMQYEKKV